MSGKKGGRWERFSKKQLAVLSWWVKGSPYRDRIAIICDGAVRSGKTFCLSLSFVLWSMGEFSGESFALCGQTGQALRRNLLLPLLPVLKGLGFRCRERSSQGVVEIGRDGRQNRYYLFGGYGEGAAGRIQGVTLAGVLFDEVALMPKSFVEQAMARCSVEGSRFWFNCNPQGPGHWFYKEWILKAAERGAYYLSFEMGDNPSLSKETLERYRRLYTGSFYERFILGRWVAPEGLIYPMFSPARNLAAVIPPCERYAVSVDYGIRNPTSMGLWGEGDGIWYRLAEYYYDGREKGSRTDEEHYGALVELAGEYPLEAVVVDPAAAGFIECVRRHGRYRVLPADNRVLEGIGQVALGLSEGWLRFSPGCVDTLREFESYCWQEGTKECPRKEGDHAMDDIRYLVMTLARRGGGGFAALSARRGEARW